MNDKIEWVLVPREPTEAMLHPLNCYDEETLRLRYAEMLEVAPKPEAQAAGVSQLQAASWAVERVLIRRMNIDKRLDGYTKEASEEMARAALTTPASHDAQQPEAAGALAGEGNALRAIAEGNLGDGPGQANYLRIREFARAALSAAPAPAQQPETEQSIKADAYDMIAEALESRGVRVSSIVDHVTGLIAQQPAVVGDEQRYRDEVNQLLTLLGEHGVRVYGGTHGNPFSIKLPRAALTPAATPGDGSSELRKLAKRHLRSYIESGSTDKQTMLLCLEELS